MRLVQAILVAAASRRRAISIVAALLLLTAGQGSARSGVRGKLRPHPGLSSNARSVDASNNTSVGHSPCTVRRNKLVYHGGPLVKNPDVFLLFWGSEWNSDADHIAAKAALISMYQSIGTSEFACAWREYGTATYPLGAGTYNDSYVITEAPPDPLSDAQIQSRIESEVLAGHAPSRTDDRVYIVIPPAGIAVESQGETGCGGANFIFCGYHSAFQSGGSFRYAVLPFPCSVPGVGTCLIDSGHTSAGSLQIVGAHELTELVTDPDDPGGWYSDRTGDENADLCAASSCNDVVTNGMTTFEVNPAWSNLANGCITSVPCSPAPIGCTDTTPGSCTPGRGKVLSCELEWLVDPNLTLKRTTQLPNNSVSCTDGQAFCDYDAIGGQCTFHVAACLNSTDPRLPLCTPSSIDSLTITRPPFGDDLTTALLSALQSADVGSTGTLHLNSVSYAPAAANTNSCTGYVDAVVPAGKKKKVGVALHTPGGVAKSQLTLSCKAP